jgi:hypothetical protein
MSSHTNRFDAWGKDVFFGAPTFDSKTLDYCRESGDWMPVAFEWYKHTAILLFRIAQLGGDDDQGLIERPHRHNAVMKGLLARSSKFMLAGLNLVAKTRFGDVLIAIQRMAIESMVKLRWLIKMDCPARFDQFIAAGLQPNIELKRRIDELTEARGEAGPLSARLLEDLHASYAISGVTEEDVQQAKGLPNFNQMLEKLGLQDHYVYIQGVASSQVHGDWSDLIANHLEYDYNKKRFSLKSSHNEPRARVCFVGIHFAFQTLREYIGYAISPDVAQNLIELINITEEEFNALYLDPVLRADGILPPPAE